MTEQIWHLKMYRLCPDNLREKTNKTNLYSSIILITIFGDYFTLHFSLGHVFFPLCLPQTPAGRVFPSPVPMTGKEEQNCCSGSHKLSQRSCPQPQLHFSIWIWGGNTSSSYDTCIRSPKSVKGVRSPSHDQSNGHAPHILLLSSKYQVIQITSQTFLGMRPKFVPSVQFKWTM